MLVDWLCLVQNSIAAVQSPIGEVQSPSSFVQTLFGAVQTSSGAAPRSTGTVQLYWCSASASAKRESGGAHTGSGANLCMFSPLPIIPKAMVDGHHIPALKLGIFTPCLP